MKILGELQVLVRIASPRIAGQPAVGEGGELTRYRLRAAIIKMAPRAILTASFLAFTKARLAYANAEEPASVELPLVDDTRIKFTWHDAASILEAHTRLNTTGAMEIHHRSFSFQPANQVAGHQGEDLVRIATDSVINYQGERIVGAYIASVQHKDGKPVSAAGQPARKSRPIHHPRRGYQPKGLRYPLRHQGLQTAPTFHESSQQGSQLTHAERWRLRRRKRGAKRRLEARGANRRRLQTAPTSKRECKRRLQPAPTRRWRQGRLRRRLRADGAKIQGKRRRQSSIYPLIRGGYQPIGQRYPPSNQDTW